jgi:flagellin-like hook-associated protein FlgL
MVDSFVGSNLFSGSSGGLITSLQQSFAPQNLGVLSQDNNTSTTIRRNDPFDIADNFSVARGIHAEFRSISSFNQQQTDAIGLARQTAATLGGATDLLRELQSLTVKVGNSGLSDQDRANLSAEFNFTPSKLGRLLDNAGLDGKNLLEQGAKDIEVPSGNPLVDLGVSASNLNETFQQIFEVTRLATTTEEFIPRNPQDVEVSINANVGISIQLDSDDIQLDDDAASNVSFNLSDLLAGSDDAVLSEDGILTFSVEAGATTTMTMGVLLSAPRSRSI